MANRNEFKFDEPVGPILSFTDEELTLFRHDSETYVNLASTGGVFLGKPLLHDDICKVVLDSFLSLQRVVEIHNRKRH